MNRCENVTEAISDVEKYSQSEIQYMKRYILLVHTNFKKGVMHIHTYTMMIRIQALILCVSCSALYQCCAKSAKIEAVKYVNLKTLHYMRHTICTGWMLQ